MCPSTDATAEQREFADEVLHKLLRHIDAQNAAGDGPYLVSHAWTDGPMMYLVYTQPRYDITWGLARDTRESIIDPGPWLDVDDAVRYYYLLDLEEGCATGWPDDPSAILWCGYPLEDGLPERPSDIPEAHRHTPAPVPSSAKRGPQVVNEPRRYADPL
jgi:hypothetical protein